jgi:hypothetical protein
MRIVSSKAIVAGRLDLGKRVHLLFSDGTEAVDFAQVMI